MSDDFMEAYIEGGWQQAQHYLWEHDEIFEEQFYHDCELLYGALMYACRDILVATYVNQQSRNADGIDYLVSLCTGLWQL